MLHIVVWYSFPSVGKQELSYTTVGNLKWCDICARQLDNAYEKPLKIDICTKPLIPLRGISPIKKLIWMHIDIQEKMVTEALFVTAKITEEKFINKGMVR